MATSAKSDHAGYRTLADAELLSTLRERGGTATRSTLVRLLDVSPLTVSRHLAHLVEQGVIHRVGHGLYELPSAEASLPTEGQEIVEALRESGAEAHVTGFDVVGSYSHQFVRAYPHVVYVDPNAIQEVAFALSQADFHVFPVGSPGNRSLMQEPERLVFLRSQPVRRMDRFGVRGPVAPIEKAWLDLLREVRRGEFPASLGDLGAMLASMVRSKLDVRRLRSWAREMGYRDHVDAVLDPDQVDDRDDLELRELAAGARR